MDARRSHIQLHIRIIAIPHIDQVVIDIQFVHLLRLVRIVDLQTKVFIGSSTRDLILIQQVYRRLFPESNELE